MFFRKLGDGLYGTPHNEDEVERSSMKILLIHDIGDLDGKLLPRDVENNFFQLSFIYIFDPWFPPLVFGRNRQYVFCHGDRKDFVGKHVIVRVVILVDIVQDLIP